MPLSAKVSSRQMLYYQILGDGESVRVTYPEEEFPYCTDNKPVGEFDILETVINEGRVFGVTEIGSKVFFGCESPTRVYHVSVLCFGTMKKTKKREKLERRWLFWREKNSVDEKIFR